MSADLEQRNAQRRLGLVNAGDSVATQPFMSFEATKDGKVRLSQAVDGGWLYKDFDSLDLDLEEMKLTGHTGQTFKGWSGPASITYDLRP